MMQKSNDIIQRGYDFESCNSRLKFKRQQYLPTRGYSANSMCLSYMQSQFSFNALMLLIFIDCKSCFTCLSVNIKLMFDHPMCLFCFFLRDIQLYYRQTNNFIICKQIGIQIKLFDFSCFFITIKIFIAELL